MKTGYIVGRFQAHELHEGYLYLIQEALKECERFGIVLSKSPLPNTLRNPFTIEERKEILRHEIVRYNLYQKFTGFTVVSDNASDEKWSNQLDEALISDSRMVAMFMNCNPNEAVPILYGSRDSFIPHYCGKLEVKLVDSPMANISSTDKRQQLLDFVSHRHYTSPVYLAGKLTALSAQYPKVYPTVDIAVFNSKGEVLLGRKPAEDLWRFPGGFVDPTDENFEAAARRETNEECGDIEIGDVTYISSVKVDDWRYRSERDKIITTFFAAKHVYGGAKAGDDLAEVKWFNIETLKQEYETVIMSAHKPLFLKLIQYLENQL